MKAFELLREIYWEAKRAPDAKPEDHKNPYRRQKLIKMLYGRTKEERVATKQKYNELFEQRKLVVEKELLLLESERKAKEEEPVD